MLKLYFILAILQEYSFLNIISYSVPIYQFFKNKNIGLITLIECSEMDLFRETLREMNSSGGHMIMLGKKEDTNNFYPTFNANYYRSGIYVDFTCNSSKELFRKISNDLLLNMSFTVLISSNNYDDTIEYLKDTTISFDSDVTVFVDGCLYDLYRTHLSQPIISTLIGIFSNSTIDYKISKKRKNLDGITINSGLVWTDGFPFNSTPEGLEQLLDYTYEPELEFLTRYPFPIHRILEDAYNFRMNITVYDDWGYFNEKLKIWSRGMFKAISLGEIDLGLSISRIFAQRLDVSFYFPPFLKFRTCFIFTHPSVLAQYTALIKPLTLNVWLCTLSAVILSGLAIWCIRSVRVSDIPRNEPDLVAGFILVLGTLCQQGLVSDSVRVSMRVMSTFLLIASFIIYTFYGGAVVGFLLSPSPKTINTVEKLMKSPIIPYAENLAYHKSHFQGNFSEKLAIAYEAIKEKKTQKERWIEITSGIQKVKAGTIALYGQDTNLYRVIEKVFSHSDICALTEIEIFLAMSSTVVRKKSPYKELLYQGMMLTHENGLLYRVRKTWQAQRPACFVHNESPAVSLEATLIAHIVYLTGLLLSLIVLILEIYIVKLRKYYLKK